jgi:hypothetical protein
MLQIGGGLVQQDRYHVKLPARNHIVFGIADHRGRLEVDVRPAFLCLKEEAYAGLPARTTLQVVGTVEDAVDASARLVRQQVTHARVDASEVLLGQPAERNPALVR